MERIEQAFRRHSRRALIPFLNAGDPTLDTSLSLFRSVLRAGADIVEIGTPYSDPLADGPVIQRSALRSLKNGFQLPQVFELSQQLRNETEQALVLFTYVNPLVQYQTDRFFSDASAAGIDGIIIPDLPFEESATFRKSADAHGIALIPLVAPTSSEARIAQICALARGFVYCVSSLGVTGERAKMSDRLQDLVHIAREHTRVPVAVGFGVSTPEQARRIAQFADGVIVGSAFIRRIEQVVATQQNDLEMASVVDEISAFTHELIDAVQSSVERRAN
jgi:tryptophan synthase alpha chain